MPPNQTQRPKFFEEQYLGAADLTAAIEYGRVQHGRHMLGGHTWGIAIGLQLKEVLQPGGAVSVHLLPGYAWDGYGRPIVVLAPYRIPEEMFSGFKDPSPDDKGHLIRVWLRYDETATQRPPPGFEICDAVDQFSRIQESFRIEVGERPNPADRYAKITIGAKTLTDGKLALRTFDPLAPLIYDESIPHQIFPEAEQQARWLIPIGYVRWLPMPSQVGHFVARDDSGVGGAEKDSDQIRKVRRYAGVVAEEIEAADGAIRLRDRGKGPAASFFRPPTKEQIANSTNDLVWVEGNLRVLGNAKLCGSLDGADLIRFGVDENGSGRKVIAFARDATDEFNAGKIAYKPAWDPAVLGIVGAGVDGDRKIRMWDHVFIQGNLQVENDLKVVGQAFQMDGSGHWATFSDERLKENINPLKDALSRLLQLHGVSFFWRSSEPTPKVSVPQMGLIAQQVEKVFPDWVTITPDGYKALTLNGFEALTIEALRELHDEIKELRAHMDKGGSTQPAHRTRKKKDAKEKEHERRD